MFVSCFVSQTMCLTELNQGLQTLQLNVSDDHDVTSRSFRVATVPKNENDFSTKESDTTTDFLLSSFLKH